MNYSVIFYIMGWILNFEAVFMILPCIVALIYKEPAGCYLLTMALCLLMGIPLVLKKPKNQIFYTAEGFVTVSLSWVVLSVMGAVPFLLSGHILNPMDALFETVSGFTTTGASILNDVETLPKCHLFWRSFTHWIGGMGVLVFILSLLPLAGGTHMNLMKAESPGPSVSKLVPKVQTTAKLLYSIYLGMTVLECVILLFGGMPLFDAITITFGTAGTGGFAIRNTSLGEYSAFQQNVVTVFMILFGVNFNVYFLFLIGKIRAGLKSEEVRCYLLVIAAAIGIITIDTMSLYRSAGEALHHAAFQVGSIITTTGYGTVDFNLWPQASRTVLVLLMFIGACAGSTGGGIKVSRFIVLFKSMKMELSHLLHPNAVIKIKMDGKVLDEDMIRSVNVYMVAYILLFAISVFLIAVDERDLITNFTAVAATFNNIGPGLELVGPTQNFGLFSNFSKGVLIFDMLAGRLEIFPMLLLFNRETWKRF